ncbi:hypothetical protein F5Y12DRAFT_761286 [Xylaria sp. FL1777]|nr:hypothetical protein F5Y12DRAFT_761286 [Xylaria sp. FL1777]
MDRYTRNIDPWGQTCLGNEPIYCDGPSPLNSDDIICPGSDDETDEATKVAKTLRYEEQGRRYLQGRPLRILSASLHGPFDKASGWQNPWLPNRPPQDIQRLNNPSLPPAASQGAQHESNTPEDKLSNEEDGTIRDVDDSMECHLPSPQSHQDLRFFNSSSHFEKHSRIESWAENVPGDFLEKDQFWAPDNESADRNADSAPKRPAGKNWLRRRPAKRRMLPASQGTEATSTPTPTPTAQLGARRSKNPVIGKVSANRSFEMTTPSSSPDRGPRESPKSVERQPVSSYGEYEQPTSSIVSAGDFQTSAEPTIRSRKEEGGGEEDHHHHQREYRPNPVNDGAFEDRSRGQAQTTTSHNIEEHKEINDLENYADASFCYRARQLKRATPSATSDATVTDCPLQNTKTEVPISPKHDVAANISSNSDIRESNLNMTRNHLNSSDVEHAKWPKNNSDSTTTDDESEHPTLSVPQPDNSLLQSYIGMFRNGDITDLNADTTSVSRVNIDRPLSDITSDKHASRLNIRNNVPHNAPEIKEARSMSTGPFFDEGVTLVNDPMDMENPGDIGLIPQNINHYCSEAFSLLQLYAISATNLANANQRSQCYNATPPTETKDATSGTVVTLSQQEPAEFQLINIKPTSHSLQEESTNLVASADPTSGQGDKDIAEVITEEQTAPPEKQSPWEPLCTASDSFLPGDDNTGRVDDEPRKSPAQGIATLLDSPRLIYYSPAIRPSQQSPWAEEVAEPANSTGLEGTAGMETAVITNVELPEIHPSPLLRGHQEHMETASSSVLLSVPRKPSQEPRISQYLESDIVQEGEPSPTTQGFLYTPTPLVARQSTPDGEVSIRSFSNFNFSSPQRLPCLPSTSVCRSILSSGKYLSTRTSTKSTRRVLFAPLPHEQEDDSNQLSTKSRAASPPPPMLVNLEEEIVDGKYRNHFDVMNRRLSVHGTPTLRHRQRLLPSSSQQNPKSPSVEAMAEAFREADAQLLDYTDNVVQSDKANEEGSEFGEVEKRPQSPWQHDTQGTDDVAIVMGNLNQFLDMWDVDTEIDRNRAELDETGTHEVPVISDMGIPQGVGGW